MIRIKIQLFWYYEGNSNPVLENWDLFTLAFCMQRNISMCLKDLWIAVSCRTGFFYLLLSKQTRLICFVCEILLASTITVLKKYIPILNVKNNVRNILYLIVPKEYNIRCILSVSILYFLTFCGIEKRNISIKDELSIFHWNLLYIYDS